MGFPPRIATDRDLGRPDRRLALTKGFSVGLTHCQACESTEGKTRLATAKEANETFGTDYKTDDDVQEHIENYVCEECSTVGEIRLIREHDDGSDR